MRIDEDLVRRLIGVQFPEWADLPIQAVLPGGWDNRTFRLGEGMVVRLPSAAAYASQPEREHRWLPRLAPHLPVPIPHPLALGEPSTDYPWHWSVLAWLEGDPVDLSAFEEQKAFAADVGRFLAALRAIDPTEGPPPGRENFFRGGPLETYDAQVQQAIDVLDSAIEAAACVDLWHEGLTAQWSASPVWVHGDFSASNLLAKNHRLCGVIDFGQCCIGDPACDLAIAWTLFDPPARAVLRTHLRPDAGTWARGRAWAIWKALIVTAGLADSNADEKARAWATLGRALADRNGR